MDESRKWSNGALDVDVSYFREPEICDVKVVLR